MNAVFQSIYEELERQRSTIIDQVKNLPAAKFNHTPSPEKWSIGQILTHLLIAEQLSVAYMKKKALGIDQLNDSGFSESIRLGVLKISQRIPAIKYKAPQAVLAHTPPAFTLDELIIRWEAQRVSLRAFLDTISDKNVKKLIYKHPVAGRLDARQALVFFREHIIHHWPQIKRLL